MFGIDRDHRAARGLGHGEQLRPGADQALLVGQGDDGACAGGRDGGFEPRDADDGRHHPVGLQLGGLDHRLAARGDVQARAGEALAQLGQLALVLDHHQFWAPLAGLLGQFLGIAAGGQRHQLDLAGAFAPGFLEQR